MKRTALLAAAAALMSAAPAAAQGYVGLQYGTGESGLFLGAQDVDTWQLEGAYGFALSPNWRAQVEGNYSTIEVSPGGELDAWGLGGHVWWQADSWRLGVGVATTQYDDASDAEEWTYAVEGSYDLGESFVVRGSYAQGSTDAAAVNVDTESVDVALVYYATPNIRLSVSGAMGELQSQADTTVFAVGGEFQPWSAPVSITLDWSKYEADFVEAEADAVQIGVRWNFGATTLRERDNATPFHLDTGFYDRLFSTW